MPSPAFARPLWPATLRALRELTRLALASLVLAVGLGGAVAADPPARSTAVSPPTATVALGSPSTAVPAVRPAVEPARAVDAGPDWRAPAATAPVRPEDTDDTSADAAPTDSHIASARAVRAGEPTRRGPPTD
ncbi:hypothetical protein O7605_17410 [Verrucosispora sp. WMMA2121]|uniref:hypothetical protein n=1 Tax=Verrucosispora sp. WMMA2121 TaxID=3015164 RepID=UPI0022B72774|nr:hypothetical protein [Verrucosispora sp. WMMA2121]MCZ7421285.1 hypothetical protein [Verrucosispora sp. WMMA2121]